MKQKWINYFISIAIWSAVLFYGDQVYDTKDTLMLIGAFGLTLTYINK